MKTFIKPLKQWPAEIPFALLLALFFWLPRIYITARLHFLGSALSIHSLANLILFDLSVIGYFLFPWLLVTLLWPKRFRNRNLLIAYLTFTIFLGAMACVSEFFFIDEFNSRYNFIAVDYLVYTSEVLQNIWESYSVLPPVLALLAFSGVAAWWISQRTSRLKPKWLITSLALFGLLFYFVNETQRLTSLSEPEKEFSKNSFFALFAAFRNNQINFEKFYTTLPHDEALKLVHDEFKKDFSDNETSGQENTQLLIENLRRNENPKNWNIVFVLMESMSAKYLHAYGGQGLTPNLDRLFENGLVFDHLYATGTRTVRGIEAVLLSLPPTPGQSIVRRPHSDNLFSLGSVLKDHGYDLSFVYGGHALFDNMREFYETNGFQVLDKGDFSSDQVHFSNAWGICDEDAFDFAIAHANDLHAKGRPFFEMILSTSNHRPYTFPDGKVDMESGGSREAAVKYSDYAIGQLIAKASMQPWFDNTLFVFVADHDAAVAGGTKILPSDYRIPFIIYSPKLIPPQKISLLSSQMDVGPTLLGLLGLSYQSRFFGHDLMRAKNERAFLGTYQKLAYMEKGRMAILSPPRHWDLFRLDGEKPMPIGSGNASNVSDPLLRTTISYYQSAAQSFLERDIGLEKTYPSTVNVRVMGRESLSSTN